jgi:putative transcriptional regulator
MSADNFLKNINFQQTEPDKGKLLISEPMLPDPNFFRSVILLTRHDEEGTVGFVLNRMSIVDLDNVLPDFSVKNIPIFIGGPVGTDQLFFIHTIGEELQGSQKVLDGLYFGGDLEQLEFLLKNELASPSQVRFFVGYSGWDANQLAREISESSWIVATTSPEQVMSDSDEYWKDVMIGLGKEFAFMANFPSNPGLN